MALPKRWKNSRFELCHLITEIKDGDTELVISKRWYAGKKRWEYVCEEKWLVEWTIKQTRDYLKKKKQRE